MSDLKDRVAIVTGSGRGIGRTIVRVLAQKGMRVGLNDVNLALAETAAEEFRAEGLRVLPLPGDVSRRAEVIDMIDRVEAELGPLWLLVNKSSPRKRGTRHSLWTLRAFSSARKQPLGR
jgi:NAD(P)-dependent dehydrogenase (short-subunit alcohol dehydrogenase family)